MKISRYILISILLVTTIAISAYATHMYFILEMPIWSIGILWPVAVGSVFGFIVGLIDFRRRSKNTSLVDAIEQQFILKEISLLSHHNYTLEELLNKAILLIVQASFAKKTAKGGVFLTTKRGGYLQLISHINLDELLSSKCAMKGVEFGECVCGIAAKEQRTIFKECIDDEHSISFDGMEYNVPILHDDKTLGVIVVYLDASYKKSQAEIDFLEAVSNVLSLILRNHSYNQEIIKKDIELKEVQEFGGIGTWKKNIDSGVITASDEVHRIMGYQPNEVELSESFLASTIHPQDRGKLGKAVRKAKGGVPFEISLRQYRKDGSTINVINKCTPTINRDGMVTDISGVVIDVSKLKENEIELAEKQHLVNGILSAVPDSLYLLDIKTAEIVYCNKAMEGVLEQHPTFLENLKKYGIHYFRKNIHPDDLKKYDKMNQALRSGKEMFTLVFRSRALDSTTYRWIEQKMLVFDRTEEGMIRQVLIISKDITNKVHTENRAKRLNVELAKQNKTIKKVNAELDQFVYSVSHDLRAPLTSMLGLVNLSKLKDTNRKDLLGYMSRIGQSAEKLDGFIMDILNYSRNARTAIDTEPINLEEIFMEIIENIKSINNPDIDLDFEADEPIVYIGDKRRISIVLNNIISNAIKYANYSKEERFIKARMKTSDKGCIITIEDNGIGIKKKYLRKIFDMFYRATDKSKGSGLGLYIVHEIVSKLKGEVNITSEEGAGTKVVIKLPHASS